MQKENTNHFDSIPEHHKNMLQAFGKYIRELRLAYGMTQIDFSSQQGIGKNSLQNAESGRNVTLLTYLKIVDGLINPSEVFEYIEGTNID
ncbi:MAG: helix-turn-helix transcriptional regulator [Bacteroidales bacterium]|jgi:transcriptional regulator with XRE-family HTH domain